MNYIQEGNLIIYKFKDSCFLANVLMVETKLIAIDIERIYGDMSLSQEWEIETILKNKNSSVEIVEIFKDDNDLYDKYPEFSI